MRGLVNSLKYDLDLYVGEDLLFLCQALNNVNSIALLKDALYCYYIYNTSSSHGQYDSKKYTEIISWNRVMKLFENKDRVFINALHRLYGWVLFSNLASMYRYGYEDEMKMNYCIEQLRKSLWSVINPMPGGDRKRLLLYLNYIVMSISPRTGYKMLDGMLSLKHKILKY